MVHEAARGKVFTVSRACLPSLYSSKMLVSWTAMEMLKLSSYPGICFLLLGFELGEYYHVGGTRLDGKKMVFE